MFKLGRRGLFLVTVMLFLAGGHQTCAAAGFTILYQDPDSIHFSYDYYYTNNTYYNYMLEEVRIEHELPNGAKEVIASAQATVAPDHSSASPITLKGSRNLQGQAAGKHLFRLIEKTRDSLYASTYTEKKIELNETTLGSLVQGTPQIDETASGGGSPPLDLGSLTLPAGRKLTLNAQNIQVSGGVSVYGQIAFQSGVTILRTASGQPFSLYSPHRLSALKGHTKNLCAFNLETGAKGSAFLDCTSMTLEIKANNIQVYRGKAVSAHVTTCDNLLLSAVENGSLETRGITQASGVTAADCKGLALACGGNSVAIKLDFTKCVMTGTLSPGKLDMVKATDCDLQGMNSLAFYQCPSGNVAFKRSKLGSVWITGGSPVIQGGEIERIVFDGPTSAVVEGNTIRNNMQYYNWGTAITPCPRVEGNSFVGPSPLNYYGSPSPWPAGAIKVGANYWGDANGPYEIKPFGTRSSFLLTRGGTIENQVYENGNYTRKKFDLAEPLKTGAKYRNDNRFPDFWCAGLIVGQNTIGHDGLIRIYEGRETLLSLDLACTDDNVGGVKVYVTIDGGAPILPYSAPSHHFRDSASYPNGNSMGRYIGSSTVNFILPPQTKDRHKIIVWLDTTGVKAANGYKADGGRVTRIYENTILFQDLPANKLRIVLQPVTLYMPFYPRGTPDATRFGDDLKKYLTMMLPVRPEDIHIIVAPAITYAGVLSTFSTTVMVNNIATALKLGESFINTMATDKQAVHYVVAVLAHGAMGTNVNGANLALRRDVLFADVESPLATLHEMGHNMGLYIDEEQYFKFPDLGLPAVGMTAFSPDPKGRVLGLNNRFLHLASPGTDGYKERGVYDLMGALEHAWPIPATHQAMASSLVSRLSSTKPSLRTPVKPARQALAAGMRRIFVYGMTEPFKDTQGWMRLRPKASSFHIFDASPYMLDPITPVYYDPYGYQQLVVDTYDAQDKLAGRVFPILRPTSLNPSTVYEYDKMPAMADNFWMGTFDIDAKAQRFYIRDYNLVPAVEAEASSALSNRILEPAAKATLGPSLKVRWSATMTRPAGYTVKSYTQKLSHVVLLSGDGGVSWKSVGMPTEATEMTVPTECLPASTKISVRVVSSDGLRTADTRVDGLTLANRAPGIEIMSPREGDVAPPGTPWELAARAWDVEDLQTDTALKAGKWSSNRSGTLLASADSGRVVLSAGTHTLTYTATDSAGRSASKSRTVTVRAMPTVDLALGDESLVITKWGQDPLNRWPTRLDLRTTGSLELRVRGTGCATQMTAVLEMIRPDGKLQPLTQKTLALGAFEEGVVVTPFNPGMAGRYTFIGRLDKVSPPDSNLENNRVEVALSTQSGMPPIFEEVLDAVLGQTPATTLTDYNSDGKTDIADLFKIVADWGAVKNRP